MSHTHTMADEQQDSGSVCLGSVLMANVQCSLVNILDSNHQLARVSQVIRIHVYQLSEDGSCHLVTRTCACLRLTRFSTITCDDSLEIPTIDPMYACQLFMLDDSTQYRAAVDQCSQDTDANGHVDLRLSQSALSMKQIMLAG